MPFYEYECSSCGHYHEALQKISDSPLRKCPACGRQTLKRLVSAPVFRLKGAGWYETDFKSDQERRRNLAGQAEQEPARDTEKATEVEPQAAETPATKAEPAASKPPAEPSRPGKAATRSAAKRPARSAKEPPVAARQKAATKR